MAASSSVIDRPRQKSEVEQERSVGYEPAGKRRFRRERQVWKVTALKPSQKNKEIFKQSLTDEGIESLIEDLKTDELRHAIEVKPDGTVVDGVRRTLALQHLGIEETEVTVVHGIETEEDLEEYIYRSFSTTRTASVEEQVNFFTLAKKVLQRKHGQGRGRPNKSDRSDQIFLDADQIGALAAKRAGFGSFGTARKAERVFREGDDSLKARVNSKDLSISAAFDLLAKPKKKSTKAAKTASSEKSPETSDTPGDDNGEAEASSNGADSGGEGGPPEPESDGGVLDLLGDDTDGDTDPDTSGEDEQVDAGGDSDPGSEDDYSDAGGDSEPEDHDSDQDGEEALAVADTDEENPIEPKAAVAVVRDLLRRQSAELARKLLLVFAADADLKLWIESDNPGDSLGELAPIVRRQIEKLAEADIDAAQGWVQGLSGELSEVISAYEPDDV